MADDDVQGPEEPIAPKAPVEPTDPPGDVVADGPAADAEDAEEDEPEPPARRRRQASAKKTDPAKTEEAGLSKWRVWEEYPGVDQMVLAQTTTSKLNSLVTAALVASGLVAELSRAGVDGNWWNGNQAALATFQRVNDTGETGIVGPKTWDLLGRDAEPTGLAKIFELGDELDELRGGESSLLALFVQSLLILNGFGDTLQWVATTEWRADSILALAAARSKHEKN